MNDPENTSSSDADTTPANPGSGLATAALICGIVGLFFLPPVAITGLVLGIIALTKGQPKGRAVTGIVLGALGLIMIPFIAIVAAIAIPNLLESRVSANEAAAGATLKSGVFPAQIQFQSAAYQDADNDNEGEYGLFSELSGRRATNKLPAGKVKLLYGPLAMGDTGSGYHYSIFLPDGHGGVISEPTGDPAKPRPVITDTATADAQERHWVAYAWPISRDTGRRMFAMCQDGQLRTLAWDGKTPEWNAVFGGGGFDATPTWPTYLR